ncbi:Uncharacterised protein [uncultured archaeon]|nr:Uncharacterised protein [uncultured archaeon]
MVTRTLQYQNGSLFTVIPRALAEAIGLVPGEKVSFGIDKGKITIAPVAAAKHATDAASTETEAEAVPACPT